LFGKWRTVKKREGCCSFFHPSRSSTICTRVTHQVRKLEKWRIRKLEVIWTPVASTSKREYDGFWFLWILLYTPSGLIYKKTFTFLVHCKMDVCRLYYYLNSSILQWT
jgi:hypothetical protein